MTTPRALDPITIAATALRLDVTDASMTAIGGGAIAIRAYRDALAEKLRPLVVECAKWNYASPISDAPGKAHAALLAALLPIIAADPAPVASEPAPTAARVAPARADPCAVRSHAWDALSWRQRARLTRDWRPIHGAECIDCPPGGCGAKTSESCKGGDHG